MISMTLRTLRVAAFMIASAVVATSASASSFDSNGTAPGGTVSYDYLDWRPSTWALTFDENLITQTATLTFQGLLGAFQTGGEIVPLPGEITYAGKVDLSLISIQSSGFEGLIVPGSGNFDVFYDDGTGTASNNLFGTGFDDGNLIFSGILTSLGALRDFLLLENLPSGQTQLDQFGGDQWNGISTTSLFGSLSAGLDPTFFDSDFFLDAPVAGEMNFNFFTPFSGSDPSFQVSGTTVDLVGTNDLSCNGFGTCDVIFEATGITTFETNSAVVPVPLPAVLLLSGLGAFGLARRRQNI